MSGHELRIRTNRRMAAFVIGMALVVALLGVQLVRVQVTDRGPVVAYGASQRKGYRSLPAGRGAIYDRSGQAFAMSVAQPMVIADPSHVRHKITTARALARILHLDPMETERALRRKSGYWVVAKDATDSQVAQIRKLVEKGTIEATTISDQYVRSTPNGDLALGVVGHALADGQVDDEGNTGGIAGIEQAYDRQLRGRPGKLWYEQDVWRTPIAGGSQKLEAARQGTDLYLTLDQALQYEAEQALAQQVTATGAHSAQAVIMRPSTGEVLAMANVRSDEDGKVANSLDNAAVTAVFEPGSTQKVFTVAAALEEGLVKPDTQIDVPSQLPIYDRTFTDSHPHPEAMWSVTDILVNSSNIGTIKIAQQLGKDEIDRYLRDFGFGKTTGLGFPAEENGIMKRPDQWSGVDIGTIPIGQGISVTALQLLAAYNVIANDGVYVAPKLVAGTDSGAGEVPSAPSATHRVISARTAAAMRAMMAKVVTDGTGKLAAVPGYAAAGKTGTARIAQGKSSEDGYLDENGVYRYRASFVGLIDGTDLSIIVSLEDPRTSIFGGEVAAPVFSHLAAAALRRYEIPPPSLATSAHDVPELSDSARAAAQEDVAGTSTTAAG